MLDNKYLNEISGWILTDGKWHPIDEWWHINAIYDLKETGYPPLQNKETNAILKYF